MQANYSLFRHANFYLLLLVTLFFGLYLDSVELSQKLPWSQWLANVLVFSVFVYIYVNVSKKLKKLMLYGLIVAFGGEVLFSLVLGMYTYRLDNLPIYVPFGHVIIYAVVYYFVKEPLVQKHKDKIVSTLYWSMILYATAWLVFANDLFGFLCMLVILWVFKRRPNAKLFFLVMFFVIVYLELIGTYFQCWVWPEIWFNQFSWVTSANPPSGIAVFYFAFDAGCLWFYKKFNSATWNRYKTVKSLKNS